MKNAGDELSSPDLAKNFQAVAVVTAGRRVLFAQQRHIAQPLQGHPDPRLVAILPQDPQTLFEERLRPSRVAFAAGQETQVAQPLRGVPLVVPVAEDRQTLLIAETR